MKLLVALLLARCCCCLLPTGALADHACGGTYRGFQYTITSPNYPRNYPARATCVYRLQGKPTADCEQRFHLQFLDFDLRASEGCEADYLRVGDSNLYCGNTAGLRQFTGTNNSLILTFRSDAKDSAKGFKILVSALPCSLKLSPLRSSPLKLGVPAAGRSSWNALDIESTAYRRAIRGDDGLDSSLTSSANRRPSDVGWSTGSAAASDNNSVINGNHNYGTDTSEAGRPRITSYLFLPPERTSANATLHYQLGADSSGSPSGGAAASLLPPRVSAAATFSSVKKVGGLPASSYGEPGGSYWPDREQSGQPQLQSDDGPSDGASYEPARGAHGYGSSPANLVYDPRYGALGSTDYYPPSAGYPAASYPGYPTGYPGYEPGYPAAGPAGPECCRGPQSGRSFSIASPGFPGAPGRLACRYTIAKASPDVCRLRLSLRFFNFGAEDPYCSLGHLAVDGRRLCGCRTGQSLQLPFGDQLLKTVSVFGGGRAGGGPAGFLIDVAQEPCDPRPPYPGSYPPAVYDPAYAGGYARRSRRELGYSYPEPGQARDRLFAGGCRARLLFDWALASKEAFFKGASCPLRLGRSDGSADEPADEPAGGCRQINDSQGEIRSPLYPSVYPGNLSQCYRFNRAPNFCKLQLYVRDFDLESSQDCASDYLSFSLEPEKYCGRSLNDRTTVFDLTRTSSLQVDFVSDDRGAGRGFDIGFSQLPC